MPRTAKSRTNGATRHRRRGACQRINEVFPCVPDEGRPRPPDFDREGRDRRAAAPLGDHLRLITVRDLRARGAPVQTIAAVMGMSDRSAYDAVNRISTRVAGSSLEADLAVDVLRAIDAGELPGVLEAPKTQLFLCLFGLVGDHLDHLSLPGYAKADFRRGVEALAGR